MTTVIIFAGGTGSRMNSSLPKQFLLVKNKPILAYTIEKFNQCTKIDKIIVVTNKNYLTETQNIIEKYNFEKIYKIIPGGENALQSQYLGLLKCEEISSLEDIILLHDGVRPLINVKTIEQCIETTSKFGNAITVSPAIETIGLMENNKITNIYPREHCILARAPQCFILKDILEAHKIRLQKNLTFVDSASMMLSFGTKLNYIEGPIENIKITTSTDYIFCKALLEKDYKNE